MTATLVQSSPAATPVGGDLTLILPGAPTAGNVLVCAMHRNSTTAAAPAPASGQGGVTTWVQLYKSENRVGTVCYVGVVDGTPSATVVVAGVGYSPQEGIVREWSGLDTAALIHGTALVADGLNGGAQAGHGPPAFSPTAGANVLLVASGGCGNTLSGDATGAWTNVLGNTHILGMAEKVVASASGSYTTDWLIDAYNQWEFGIGALNVAIVAASAGRGRPLGSAWLAVGGGIALIKDAPTDPMAGAMVTFWLGTPAGGGGGGTDTPNAKRFGGMPFMASQGKVFPAAVRA